MALATLSIDLVAQTAKFEADMRRSAGVVEAAATRINGAFGGIGTVFAGSVLASAATEAIRGLVQLFPDLVNGAARFQDLEEKTGASAEALASFTTAGDVAGVSADQLAGFMVKLTSGLAKTSDEAKGVGPAIAALGIDFESFRQLAPEKQFELIAQRLATFKDGAGKTAIAVALLGKSGADALPFFKELAQSGLTQNRLTAEQIRLADAYADRQARLKSELKQAAQIAALQALPAFTALTEQLSRAARDALGLDDAASKLGTNTGVRDFAQGAALTVAVVAESVAGLIKLVRALGGSFESVIADSKLGVSLAGNINLANGGGVFNSENRAAFKQALEDRNRIAAEANDRYVKLFEESGTRVSDALKFQFSEAGRIAARIQADPAELARRGRPIASAEKPGLNFRVPDSGGGGGAEKAAREAEQTRKALLDQALRNLESSFQNESAAIQFHARFLEAQYDAGLVSVADFYSTRNDIEARALDAQLARFEKERSALQAFLAETSDPSKRIETLTKIEEVEARAGRARQQFRDREALDRLQQDREEEQRLNRAREFQAQLLELQGNASAAAALRADAAIDQARRSATGSGLTPQQLQEFEAATRAALRFGDAQRDVQRITEQASIAEQRFLIIAEASGASRIEVEQGLRAIRTQALAQLSEQIAKTEALAAAAGPDSPAVQFARQLRLEFERLSVSVDPAMQRLRQVGDEVASALGQAAGAISLNFKDAKSAVASLGDALLRISTRELIEIPLTDFFRKQIRGLTEGPGAGGGLGAVLKGAFGFPASTGTGDQGNGVFSLAGAFGVPNPGAALGSANALGGLSTAPAVFALDALAVSAQNAAIALGGAGGGGSLINSIVGGKGSSGAFDFIGDSFIKLFGLANGGYTGPGARLQPAGIVHKGEVVWSQDDVRQAGGVQVVEAMRLGRRGYADGGAVGMPFRPGAVQTSAPGGRNSRGGNTTVNLGGVTVDSHGQMDSMAEDRAAQRIARKAERYLSRRGA